MKRQAPFRAPRKVAPKKPALARQGASFNVAGYQAGRELNKQPKQELKCFDVARTSLAILAVATPPTFNILNAMINGAELHQRVGRKTYAKSLRIRGYINQTALGSYDYCRILVVYDAQPNAAFPTIANLLQDANAGAATTALSGINMTNRARFQILRDHPILLPESSAADVLSLVPDTVKNSLNIDMFIPLKGLESVYNGTNGGTVADIQSGAIFMVVVSDATGTADFVYTSRLRYYD